MLFSDLVFVFFNATNNLRGRWGLIIQGWAQQGMTLGIAEGAADNRRSYGKITGALTLSFGRGDGVQRRCSDFSGDGVHFVPLK
jgi:hypothetical protein